jgi:hypothetical protein
MSNESPEATPPASNGAAAPAETTPAAETASAKTARVREAVTAIKRHPLGVVALAGAAVALVEVEVAVGILAGIGATALLVTKSGPEARQEVLTKGNEVLAKGKLALAKAKGKLSRAKAAGKSPEPPAAPPAAAA